MEQWANSVCKNRPILEKEKERKHSFSTQAQSVWKQKTQPIHWKGMWKKKKICRTSQRKLTDQQCWSNGNGRLGTKKLEGFHALVHVNSAPIIYEIKISEERVSKFKRGALE